MVFFVLDLSISINPSKTKGFWGHLIKTINSNISAHGYEEEKEDRDKRKIYVVERKIKSKRQKKNFCGNEHSLIRAELNVCVLTDLSVQPNTGKYTLARFSKENQWNREDR